MVFRDANEVRVRRPLRRNNVTTNGEYIVREFIILFAELRSLLFPTRVAFENGGADTRGRRADSKHTRGCSSFFFFSSLARAATCCKFDCARGAKCVGFANPRSCTRARLNDDLINLRAI